MSEHPPDPSPDQPPHRPSWPQQWFNAADSLADYPPHTTPPASISRRLGYVYQAAEGLAADSYEAEKLCGVIDDIGRMFTPLSSLVAQLKTDILANLWDALLLANPQSSLSGKALHLVIRRACHDTQQTTPQLEHLALTTVASAQALGEQIVLLTPTPRRALLFCDQLSGGEGLLRFSQAASQQRLSFDIAALYAQQPIESYGRAMVAPGNATLLPAIYCGYQGYSFVTNPRWLQEASGMAIRSSPEDGTPQLVQTHVPYTLTDITALALSNLSDAVYETNFARY
jgi:hypothetical protein